MRPSSSTSLSPPPPSPPPPPPPSPFHLPLPVTASSKTSSSNSSYFSTTSCLSHIKHQRSRHLFPFSAVQRFHYSVPPIATYRSSSTSHSEVTFSIPYLLLFNRFLLFLFLQIFIFLPTFHYPTQYHFLLYFAISAPILLFYV